MGRGRALVRYSRRPSPQKGTQPIYEIGEMGVGGDRGRSDGSNIDLQAFWRAGNRVWPRYSALLFRSKIFRRHRGLRAGIRASSRQARCGGVAFIQRFSDALNLDPHFHILVLDGTYLIDGKGVPVFRRVSPPTDKEVSHSEEVSKSSVSFPIIWSYSPSEQPLARNSPHMWHHAFISRPTNRTGEFQ